MPMSWPDLPSLRRSFDRPTAVPYQEGESEKSYRDRCAAWSEESGDLVQAHEVRTGKGWDEWTEADKVTFLFRRRP